MKACAPLVSLAAVVVVALLGPTIASADIPPPQRSACYDKKVGEACRMGATRGGVCAVDMCTGRTGEAFDCVVCTEPASSAAPRPDRTPVFAAPLFDASAVAPGPSAPSEATARPTASTHTPSPPAPVSGGGCGRCAISTTTRPGDRLGALGLAIAAAIIVARRSARTSRGRGKGA